jgi:hypothetical protein
VARNVEPTGVTLGKLEQGVNVRSLVLVEHEFSVLPNVRRAVWPGDGPAGKGASTPAGSAVRVPPVLDLDH